MKRRVGVVAISILIALAIVATMWAQRLNQEAPERIQLEPPTRKQSR